MSGANCQTLATSKRARLEGREFHLPDSILTGILSRLPLASIARLKSVCREWKSLIESRFFRQLYQSLNRGNSSSISWSLVRTTFREEALQVVSFHGCERWALAKSLGSYLSSFERDLKQKSGMKITAMEVAATVDGLVLLYVVTRDGEKKYFLGNPVLGQWFHLPLPPWLSLGRLRELQSRSLITDTGLVTDMDKNSGCLLGYKVVWVVIPQITSSRLSFWIYSSETGLWSQEEARCPVDVSWYRLHHPVHSNGHLHWLDDGLYADNFVARGFFASTTTTREDLCHVIPFPDTLGGDFRPRFRRTLTTSGGSLVYINEDAGRELRVWRLNDDYTTGWKLQWSVNLGHHVDLGLDYFPVAMHPLKDDVIYLWSVEKEFLVSYNLGTHRFTTRRETESGSVDHNCNCIVRFNYCPKHMKYIYQRYAMFDGSFTIHRIHFHQFVLPPWFDPIPLPPGLHFLRF